MKNENKELNLDELMEANGGFMDDTTIEMIKKKLDEQGIPYNDQTIEQILEKKYKFNPTKRPTDPTFPGGCLR